MRIPLLYLYIKAHSHSSVYQVFESVIYFASKFFHKR